MKRVIKHQLNLKTTSLRIAKNAKILDIILYGNIISIALLVEDNAPTWDYITRRIFVVTEDALVPDEAIFINSLFIAPILYYIFDGGEI